MEAGSKEVEPRPESPVSRLPSLGHQLAVNLDEMRLRARSDVDLTWAKGDAEVITFPEPEDETPIYLQIRRVGGAGIEPATSAL